VPVPGTPYKTPNLGAVITGNGVNTITITYTVPLVTNTGTLDTWSVVIAPYYLVINVPKTEGFIYSTYGLCGYYNNNPADDFTSFQGNTYLVSAGGQRFNGGPVLPWGATFGVATGNNWVPLGDNFKHTTYEDGKWVTMDASTPPPMIIPSVADQALLDQIHFLDIPTMAAIQNYCAATVTTVQQYENCVYDNGQLSTNDSTAWTLGQSNHLAAQQVTSSQTAAAAAVNNTPTTTINNTGTKVGIACGIVGGVGLLLAAYFFCRRGQVKAEMSRALIVKDNKTGVQMST